MRRLFALEQLRLVELLPQPIVVQLIEPRLAVDQPLPERCFVLRFVPMRLLLVEPQLRPIILSAENQSELPQGQMLLVPRRH